MSSRRKGPIHGKTMPSDADEQPAEQREQDPQTKSRRRRGVRRAAQMACGIISTVRRNAASVALTANPAKAPAIKAQGTSTTLPPRCQTRRSARAALIHQVRNTSHAADS